MQLATLGARYRVPSIVPDRRYAEPGGLMSYGSNAIVVARLKDGRVMAIECKVSNSTVNSYKRLVHDTGGKAAHWYNQLGRAQVIPSAVLSGVYSTANLLDVQ